VFDPAIETTPRIPKDSPKEMPERRTPATAASYFE
jgi:hypothetical protein